MAVVSTVCPLDLNSQDQLQLIACEANHLMGDYPGDRRLIELLVQLRDASIELKDYWASRHKPKPVEAAAPVKTKKTKKREA